MSNQLQKIIDYKKQELEHQKRKISLKDVRLKAEEIEPARDFLGALKIPGIRIIAEIKKASPSAGVICKKFDPVKIAQQYEEGGAACLSVLTDEHFFQGHLSYLQKIKQKVSLPLLRKDFTLEDYHLYEARGAGADAVLLIVRILEDAQLKDYADLAQELGMTPLFEVHEDVELERAKKTGARLVGINNRNLDTFQVSLETSVSLAKKVSQGILLVAESGISTAKEILRLQTSGISAFLIGESLMKLPHPGKGLKELIQDTTSSA